ncbi:hypothetical protein AHAS_Ahas10G0154800 [Arachis hypogaea]
MGVPLFMLCNTSKDHRYCSMHFTASLLDIPEIFSMVSTRVIALYVSHGCKVNVIDSFFLCHLCNPI